MAIVYFGKPETLKKGLPILKEYIKENPEDKDAPKALEAIEQSNIFYEIDKK